MESDSIGNSMNWRRRLRNSEGSVLLETVIVLPVLLLFMMVIMELCLLGNAKQLANYAAFCAARTAAVQELDQDVLKKAHFAAAMALSSIAPQNPQDAELVLTAYGMSNPEQTLECIGRIPGFEETGATWPARLANAYVRTSQPVCDTGTVSGTSRKYLTVDITYIHRCSAFPFGNLWGSAELESYLALLRSSPFYNLIAPAVSVIENARGWNVPVHGRAITDYWQG